VGFLCPATVEQSHRLRDKPSESCSSSRDERLLRELEEDDDRDLDLTRDGTGRHSMDEHTAKHLHSFIASMGPVRHRMARLVSSLRRQSRDGAPPLLSSAVGFWRRGDGLHLQYYVLFRSGECELYYSMKPVRN
jgi:hypothetical protein